MQHAYIHIPNYGSSGFGLGSDERILSFIESLAYIDGINVIRTGETGGGKQNEITIHVKLQDETEAKRALSNLILKHLPDADWLYHILDGSTPMPEWAKAMEITWPKELPHWRDELL